MQKKKILYFLMMIVILSLIVTGCSSGGGDSATPGNNDKLPGTGGPDSISISGNITLPKDSPTVSGLDKGNNKFEMFLTVKDFEDDKVLTNLKPEPAPNSKGKYKYTVTDKIKSGQDLLIEAFYEEKKSVSTYIPDIGNNSYDGSADVDPVSTLVAEIIKKVQNENNKVKILPKEVEILKEEVKKKYSVSLKNKNSFEEKINEIKKGEDKSAKEIEKEIKEFTDSNTGDIGSAKEMVNFVRNAGLFLEDSAAVQEKTIKTNMETVSKTLEVFTKGFETELDPLFISNFANRAPNNYPKSPESYTLAELDQDETMDINLETLRQLPVLKWKIKDGDNTILVSTDSMNAFKFADDGKGNKRIVSIDFSSARLDYKINNLKDNYYFDGSVDVDSSRTVTETIENGNNEKITLIIPEKAEGDIVGEIKVSDLQKVANIDIKLTEDSQLNEDSISSRCVLGRKPWATRSYHI